MAGMEMKALAKSYGSHLVLSGVDLTVDDGEFIVLVGPSGCGKSTLLRMIAGLEPITAGEFAIGGKRMNEVAPRDRDIAMVFQSYALYPHMDVARNMGFSMEIRGRSKTEREQPVRDAAATLGLGALLERLPKALPSVEARIIYEAVNNLRYGVGVRVNTKSQGRMMVLQ